MPIFWVQVVRGRSLIGFSGCSGATEEDVEVAVVLANEEGSLNPKPWQKKKLGKRDSGGGGEEEEEDNPCINPFIILI